MIRIGRPDLNDQDIARVVDVLQSGQLVQSEQVRRFEDAVSRVAGTRHAVAVNSCTSALYLALCALDIRHGDRVLVSAYSWPATGNVIELAGGIPVFVDVDARTFNMSPRALTAALEAEIRQQQQVKAVMVVHAFGLMADVGAIGDICRSHGLPIIEDAACALGATVDARPAGSWGVMGCFSFHPRKAITTGEGGMIATNDEGVARKLRALRNHGLSAGSAVPDFVMAGHNMRLTEFQAALGVSQMERIEATLLARRQLALRYDRLLRDTPVLCPVVPDGFTHVYQSYVVLLPAAAAARRKEIIAGLRARGIETNIGTYFMPAIRHFAEQGWGSSDAFPECREMSPRALALPMHARLTEDDQRAVVDALRSELR